MRLEDVANRTPVVTSRTANALADASLFFKCENFQRAGAFKFRGAFNAISRLSPDERSRGVLTYSSGNHAQAVALACRELGIPAVVVMPSDAPSVKLEATRTYGAEIILYDRAETTREDVAARVASERGLPIVPPYDHPHIVAGQGTTALELFAAVSDIDVLLVCCGGGGLLSGCAIAARYLTPRCHVVGIEPERADDATRSFRTGTLHTVHNPDTIADGARTPSLGRVTFPLVRKYVNEMETVSEDAIVKAMRFLWERMKLVVEPTGALAFAAVLDGRVDVRGKRAGIVISGGNVDVAQVSRIFEE
jgi:threo-3-hydroxy-L-aspartate ammonia-lyase